MVFLITAHFDTTLSDFVLRSLDTSGLGPGKLNRGLHLDPRCISYSKCYYGETGSSGSNKSTHITPVELEDPKTGLQGF